MNRLPPVRAALVGLALLATPLLALAAAPTASFTLKGQNDLRFSKTQLTVAPGEKVSVKLVNDSNLPASAMSHNWVLLRQGANASKFDQAAMTAEGNGYIPPNAANQIIAHTGMVAGGHSDTVTFTAPTKPGNYVYICTFPGHYMAGMKGTLTVKAGS